ALVKEGSEEDFKNHAIETLWAASQGELPFDTALHHAVCINPTNTIVVGTLLATQRCQVVVEDKVLSWQDISLEQQAVRLVEILPDTPQSWSLSEAQLFMSIVNGWHNPTLKWFAARQILN